MLKHGIINADIKYLLASLGHRDRIAITDAGYNVPSSIPKIDIAVLPGMPELLPILDGVLDEIAVEQVVLAEEIKSMSPKLHEEYRKRFPEKKICYIPHSEFDEVIKDVKGVIRTGQYGLHAPNIILQAGCTYDSEE